MGGQLLPSHGRINQVSSTWGELQKEPGLQRATVVDGGGFVVVGACEPGLRREVVVFEGSGSGRAVSGLEGEVTGGGRTVTVEAEPPRVVGRVAVETRVASGLVVTWAVAAWLLGFITPGPGLAVTVARSSPTSDDWRVASEEPGLRPATRPARPVRAPRRGSAGQRLAVGQLPNLRQGWS